MATDPVAFQIQQEVEEFLRDLTLEYSFDDIFESLKRFEYRDRYGAKITPLPRRRIQEEKIKEIHFRLTSFLNGLKRGFGSRYANHIDDSLRYYTQTTFEN